MIIGKMVNVRRLKFVRGICNTQAPRLINYSEIMLSHDGDYGKVNIFVD